MDTTTMKRSTATILLLMLSLVSLASAGDVDNTIRLPSDGKGIPDEASMALTGAREKLGGEERPWECCDRTICTRSMPPLCLCLDQVERCAAACKRCEPADSDRSLYVCRDQYFGDPGPSCTDGDAVAAAGGN
ncbi:hypothetical protein VPH35_057510 [Triticum aestivum]|uniref:Bowman-Birk type bran trypsin inhibitor n=1 Tax=Triticum aestivum TaxID=4565 RepID=UPI000DF5B85B|nr:Bowman-Birk type bran trypsin inhibitor-like [Triticum aestivum]